MKTIKTSVWKTAFALCIFLLVSLISIKANASVGWPSVSSNSYCEFTAERNINVYRDTNFKTRGTCSPAKSYNAAIYKNDVCYVYHFTNSYLQVSYPTSSGRKTGYIRRTDFVVSPDLVSPISLSKSNGTVTTYKFPSNSVYGNTASGDQIFAVGQKNGYTAIIYTAKSGKRAYKYGFVKTGDYSKITSNSSSPAPAASTPATTPSPSHATPKSGKLPWPTLTSNKYKGGFSLYEGHNGMDISAKSGSALYSPFAGTAKYFQRYREIKGKKVLVSYGNYVELISSDGKYKMSICHMSSFNNVRFAVENPINAIDYFGRTDSTLSVASWRTGDKETQCGRTINVSVGTLLGYSGGTGRSTGPHLHVTLYVKNSKTGAYNLVDPYSYFDSGICAADCR